ncbi:MAG: CPBP family intramembrane metalloprotease [Fibrobacteria bacterium]|nr:CPBP family intramembrane metalloprotease [Fibrobacteria bacterium]
MNRMHLAIASVAFLALQGAMRIESAWFATLVYVYPVLYLLAAVSCLSRGGIRDSFVGGVLRRSMPLWVGATLGVYAVSFLVLRGFFGPSDDWTWSFRSVMETSVPGGRILFSSLAMLSLSFYAIEEFYFRGVLFEKWEGKFGKTGTVVAISGLWACLHLGTYGLNPFRPWLVLGMLPCVFAMGLVLGAARSHTGSPWTSFVCQSLGNWFLLGLVYSAPAIQQTASGGAP